jgi:NADH dehydrogenase FAD-containing subunit
MMGKKHVVILGGGYAGLVAAARLGEGAGPEAVVTLVDARPEFTQRVRLHELLAGRRVRSFAYAPLLARRGLRFVQGCAEYLDPDLGRLIVRSPEGVREELPYDHLVLALGSRTSTQLPGVHEYALGLDDPERIRRAGAALPSLAAAGGRVLVVGSGLSGIETAAELAERYPGLRVILAGNQRLGAGFSAAGAAHFRQRLTSLRVELLEEVRVAGLEPGNACLADGQRLPFDLCVWTAGFTAPSLARDAGLGVDPEGRVRVDPMLRSESHPHLYAVGDAALARVDGHPLRMACATAMPMGGHTGVNLCRELRGEAPLPFQFGFALRCVSLGRKEALVQFVNGDDTPREEIWTGRRARWMKEFICRATYQLPQWELKLGRTLYHGPRSPEGEEACPAARPQETLS